MKPANTRDAFASSKPSALLLALLFISLFTLHPSLTASVKVGGFGLFGNAELKNSLRLLELEDGPLYAQKIDDGAFLLLTRLTQNGYLDASITANYETASDTQATATWTNPFEPQLPEDVVATQLQYQIDPGLLYYYNEIEIQGLASIPQEEALNYFVPDTALYSRKKDRSYSPTILGNHQKQLAVALAALGRTDAKVTTSSIQTDKTSGAVDIALLVTEGPLYKVVAAEVHYLGNGDATEPENLPVSENYSRVWVEDQVRQLRNESYRIGYPDTKVTSRILQATPEGDTVSVKMRFDVQRGPKKTLTSIEHRGATDTHLPLLNRKSDLDTGVPLDITEVESARRRLSSLGIFDRIDLRYEDDGESGRKAIFEYTNGQRVEAQLLLGYGSYESFRAGLIARRENLFGRAHSLTFQAVQSVKSTSGKLSYAIPEILGENINGTFEANYLSRQELNFDREERGVSTGLSKRLPQLKTDLGLDYAFERKKAENIRFDRTGSTPDPTNIGSLSFRATRNTLDNILYPNSGYELTTALTYAATELGGEAEFFKPEIGAAYHRELGSHWIFHISLKGGHIDNSDISIVNERFTIGGENSVRGYRRGEAGPLDDTLTPVPAQAYTLLNAELEYPILNKLNAVIFADAVRVWAPSENLDIYEDLSSIGIGLRYSTIIGPVRLEYGHNLDPRPQDPQGTVHLSVGFPF